MSEKARVFVTGSADGLGRATAQSLLENGHTVVVHVRNSARLAAVQDLVDRGATAVVGDLSDLEQTRSVARQVNSSGRMDAVVHNAGVLHSPDIFQVNVAAPYLLTALIDRPQRLVYLSSGMHRGGHADLGRLQRGAEKVTYSDSKLYLTALAAARRPLMAGRPQQRGGSRLGAHPDGRRQRPGRPAAGPSHPGVARHQR